MLDIFVDSRPTFERIRLYKLNAMLRGLRRAQIPWRIIDKPQRDQGGETAFVHVDLTDVPGDFVAAAQRYTRCVNRDASSIRRTLYTRARIFQDDNWPGPVIVKSVLNGRGGPELRYRHRQTFATRVSYIAKTHLLPGYKQWKCPKYEIYSSLNDVPYNVWQDPRLIVERFLPGTLNLPIIKHRFDFFYEVGINTRASHHSLLCDPDSISALDLVHEIPPAIQELRKELGLDYGSIDYFMVRDEAIPIDANKTVTFTDSWIDRWPALAHHLKEVTDRLIEFVRTG